MISVADGPRASDLRSILWRAELGEVGDVGVTSGENESRHPSDRDEISESNDTLLDAVRLQKPSETSEGTVVLSS